VLVGVFLAFLIGSVIGAAGVVSRRLRMSSAIAFGPSMLVACWLVLAVPQLVRWLTPGVL